MSNHKESERKNKIVEEKGTKISSFASKSGKLLNKEFYKLYKMSLIPENFVLNNPSLFLKRQNLSRIITMYDLYKKVLDVTGIICEFGLFWGRGFRFI